MLLDIYQRHRAILVISLVGLMMSMALWGGSTAFAEETEPPILEAIEVPNQTVTIKNSVGDVLGIGIFSAAISQNRHGQMSGYAHLQTQDYTVKFVFDGVDVINYSIGGGSSVVLSGRGTKYSAGYSESFAAKVTVRGGATTTIPDCLIWDIPGPPVLDPMLEGLNFDAEGTLSFSRPGS